MSNFSMDPLAMINSPSRIPPPTLLNMEGTKKSNRLGANNTLFMVIMYVWFVMEWGCSKK